MKTFKQHVKEQKDSDIPARGKYSKSGGFYYWDRPVKWNSKKKFYYHPKGAKPYPPGLHTKPTDKYEEVSQKEIDKFHTSLDKLVHKSFGHSSDEKKKEMKKEEKDIPKGYHKMPDGTIMKDSEHKKEEVKETHSFVTNKQNQKQKEVGGEKEPIKTSKNEWKTFAMMAAELREKKEEKKEQEAGEDTRDPKDKTMTGKVATSPEMNPRVDYKY